MCLALHLLLTTIADIKNFIISSPVLLLAPITASASLPYLFLDPALSFFMPLVIFSLLPFSLLVMLRPVVECSPPCASLISSDLNVITPQASLSPAFPVFKLSASPPFPNRPRPHAPLFLFQSRICLPLNLPLSATMLDFAIPSLSATTFSKSPTWPSFNPPWFTSWDYGLHWICNHHSCLQIRVCNPCFPLESCCAFYPCWRSSTYKLGMTPQSLNAPVYTALCYVSFASVLFTSVHKCSFAACSGHLVSAF